MLTRKFHINQPDVSYTPRVDVVGVSHVAAGRSISGVVHDRAISLTPRAPFISPTLAPEILHIRPGIAFGSKGKPIFRTALHAGQKAMIINDLRGFEYYKQFPSQFKACFPGVQPAPGLEVIGCGYNIFGMYAEASSLKRPLFDINKMTPLAQTTIGGTTYYHWPITTLHDLSSSRRQTRVGETAIGYAQKLSAAAGLEGSYLGFHAQVEMDFSTSTTRNMYFAFSNVFDVTQVSDIRLNDQGDLRNYLTAEALNAIDNADGQWSPDRLFDEFGLYYLTGAVMGGRMNHWSYVDTFYLETNTDIGVMAEASFLDLVGGTSSVQSSSAYATYQRNSTSETATLGGDPSKGGGSIVDQASYQAWKDTVLAKPAFLDFTDPLAKKPLMPIWSLATGARRAELEARVPAYEANISSQFENEHPIDLTPKAVTYIVTTHTGTASGAGTNARITVVLYGKDRFGNDHETQEFNHDDSRDNHCKGGVDAIAFEGVADVGELNNIKFTHYGDVDKGAWQLKNAEVECLENGKLYKAYYDGWLDRNYGVFPLLK